MTQILRFEMNVPAEVALKDAGPGKPIEGRYGNRVMYTLVDDRVMYVAPIVASQITDLGIQPGEPFQVRKQLKKQGRRRLIEWDVQRLASGPETQLEHELRESIAVAQAAKASQPSEVCEEATRQSPIAEQTEMAAQCAVPTPAIIHESNGSSRSNIPSAAGNGKSLPVVTTKPDSAPTAADDAGTGLGGIQEPAVPPIPAPSPAVPIANGSTNQAPSSAPANKNGNTPAPVTTKLEHALKTAISAAYNAEKYGADLGYVVRFDADAIKSMAITVLINMSEGNRR